MNCSRCHKPIEGQSAFCRHCGHPVARPTVCPDCSAPIATGDAFCRLCGHQLAPKTEPRISLAETPPAAAPEPTRAAPPPAPPAPGGVLQPRAVPAWEPPVSSEPARQTRVVKAEPAAAAPRPSPWKDLPRQIVVQMLWRIPIMVLTLLPAWVMHTYLLVIKNDGFSKSSPWAPFINLSGNSTCSFAVWGLSSGLLWSVVISMIRCGPGATIAALAGAPGRCLALVTRSDAASRAGVAMGVGVMLLGASYFGLSPKTKLIVSFSTLFLGMGYPGMLLGRLLGDIYDRFKARYPLLQGFQGGAFAEGLVAAIPVGLAVAWLFSSWTGEKLGMVLVAFAIYNMYGSAKSSGAKLALFMLGASLLLEVLLGQEAWAHDGGWQESTQGGDLTWANIVRWWNAPGSGQAITQGAVPAIGAAAGAAMVPPVAPPTNIDYKEDVSQTVTKGDEEFTYGLGIARQGSKSLPADGKTEAFGYSVGESNDPKVKPGDLARRASFTTTAPPGFELRIVREDSAFGGDHKQYAIVAVAAPESAFAPGSIPGAVYAEATSPAGPVRGHMEYTILVGTGKLHIEPLERSWLRADGQDSLQLQAYIDATDGAQISDEERKSTLELAAYGPNAQWVGVSTPGNGEFYRYWTVQAAKASDPKLMVEPLPVELGLQGRFAGGLFQEKIPLQVLPPARLKASPEIPFLVPDHLEKLEVQVEVQFMAPKEEWKIEHEFKGGDKQAVILDDARDNGPGKLTMAFSLGRLDEDKSCVEATWRLVGQENKGGETDELLLRVVAARPGVVILSKTPFQVLADGHKEQELLLTVLRWNQESQKVEVDEAALQKVEFEVVKEGEASKALEAAQLQFKFKQALGNELNRHAIYGVSTLMPVPGMGFSQGKFDCFMKGEEDPNFRRPLAIALALDAITLTENNKETEWKLLMDVLERYFKRPYDKAEDEDKSRLSILMDVYNKWMEQLTKDKPCLGAGCLRDRRKLILKSAVATWQAIGEGYMTTAKNYEYLLRLAVTVDWFVDNAFSTCAKAMLAPAGPIGAAVGAVAINKARTYLTKLVANAINGIPMATTIEDITQDAQDTLRDFFWTDAPELLLKKLLGAPNKEGEIEVSVKVKAAIWAGFIAYRFYRNYNDDDPVTKEKPVGFWRAAVLTGEDIGMKFAGDVFENYVKTLNLCKGGPKVGDLKPGGGWKGTPGESAPSGPSAPDGGSSAPSGPSTPDGGHSAASSGPSGPDGGSSSAPSGPSAPSGHSAAPSGPSGPDGGSSSAPSGPSGPDGGHTAPSGPSSPDGGHSSAPSGPSAPDSGSSSAPSGPSAPASGSSTPPSGPPGKGGIPRLDLGH